MQIKSVRGAVVTVAAGAAILGAPAVAQAATIPLEPAPQEQVSTQPAAPVLALWDPQTGSASLSSNVNARFLCVFQSISAAGGLDCLNGQN
ncbi:hypothetical protein [Nocardia terpenica]|uniref:Uncharacterized protein n=1 Tax=Nocardia terpenica TaxID=455432 RepID=A0A164JA28_9NOCA|nr:hypothetical protein [Nocardia terpenica]ATL69497.1 hypothetical protein CRH09_28280 [Nocardia terpenica]KZM70193.1 hypothetical protein AWN90_06495 [Nocardia terpenica]MBF6063821.1 hypothetical protein [Nocardia terpenica]MBF6108527.1 hypothetical protein [Nocardia terpenica]MBF6116073.1 hypothetical protein [Nocardia terpenica]